MIEIVYDRPKHSVDIKGHANFAEVGQDIICSAASILAYTLAGNVEKLGDGVRSVKVRLDNGDAHISCSHIAGMKSVVTLVFDSVCTGFELLEHEFPDRIKYTLRDR